MTATRIYLKEAKNAAERQAEEGVSLNLWPSWLNWGCMMIG